MKIKSKNLIISLLLSALGTIFLIYYIFRASVDVVASDYIRIINYYLEDVTDLKYLLSWEGISRIPFTFLARFINVKLFRYSVFFDKILGTFGLFLFNTVVVSFTLDNLKSKFFKIISSILITYISFSLMAWEMILNGTGYAHFITVGLIALTFKIFSKIVGADIIRPRMGELCEPKIIGARPIRIIYLCLLISFTSILFAASYAVSYNLTIILFAIIFLLYGIINDKISRTKDLKSELIDEYSNKKEFKLSNTENNVKYFNQCDKRQCYVKKLELLCLIIIPIICLLLYFKSNNTGEALIPIGFKDITLIELIKTDPLFPIRFLLKSLASQIIGVETLEYAINFNTITEKMIFFIGFLFLIVIIYAIIILIIEIWKIVKAANMAPGDDGNVNAAHIARGDTSYLIFVSMFFIYGIANYFLVFLARYRFVVDSYGMTSRYSLQYMFLTIGIVMILIKFLDDHAAHIVRGDDGNVNAAHTVGADANTAHIVRGDDAVGADTIRPIMGKLCEPASVWASSTSPKKIFLIIASVLSLSFIMLGHLTTNTDEIFKADYRKIIYSIVEDKAKNYKILSDEELENSFEYHRGPEQIKHAFEILENQKLNVFKD